MWPGTPNSHTLEFRDAHAGKRKFFNTPAETLGALYEQSRAPANMQQTAAAYNADGGSLNDRVLRYLDSIPQNEPEEAESELLLENRSLHQRIAALQRTERDLLRENQKWLKEKQSMQKGKEDLLQQYNLLKKHYEGRRQLWKDERRQLEEAYEDRIDELQAQLADKEAELNRRKPETTSHCESCTSLQRPLPGVEEIDSWISARSNGWQIWATTYAHRDPQRLQSGLTAGQMTELCHSVKEFVNLTSEGTLPDALLSMKGAQATQALLHGMLSDFIVEETLKSPFWVFAALSHGDKIDLESPCLLFNNFQSLTPIGLKMPDLPIWNSHLAQPAAKGVSIETQGAKLRMGLPPLTTAIASAPGPKTPGHGLSDKALHVPDAHSMENLYRILMNGM